MAQYRRIKKFVVKVDQPQTLIWYKQRISEYPLLGPVDFGDEDCGDLEVGTNPNGSLNIQYVGLEGKLVRIMFFKPEDCEVIECGT